MTRDKLEDLLAFDGLLFGVPTRFGMMPAEMKAFFDSTGQMWSKGQLVGKPAGVFFSTALVVVIRLDCCTTPIGNLLLPECIVGCMNPQVPEWRSGNDRHDYNYTVCASRHDFW